MKFVRLFMRNLIVIVNVEGTIMGQLLNFNTGKDMSK